MSVTIHILLNKAADEIVSQLVFDVEDIKKLRKLGICGILMGTLPPASQQNVFLSVPLRLMMEETLWLYEKGYAKLVLLNSPIDANLASKVHENSVKLSNISVEANQKSFESQRQYKTEQHRRKLEALGLLTAENNDKTAKDIQNNQKLIESSLFVEIPNSSRILSLLDKSTDEKDVISKLYSNCGQNYHIFRDLKNQNYVLAPGARFGGRFIAYPGDPLRFHSHLTVQNAIDYYNDPIDLLSLIGGSRLGLSLIHI